MKLSAAEYMRIVENSPSMIWRADRDGKCDYVNQTWLDFTGRTLEQEIGDGWKEGVFPDDLKRRVATSLESLKKGKPFDMEYRLRRYDNQWRWIHDSAVPLYGDDGEVQGFIGSCVDVNDKAEAYFYHTLSEIDNLTDTYNRQFLMQHLDTLCSKHPNTHTRITVALMDIDHFKLINNRYGHGVGDKALKLFASVAKKHIRDNDIFCRYGIDEFVILFQDTSIEVIERIINRINLALQPETLETAEDIITLTVSVGICECKEETMPEKMFYIADQRLQENRRNKQQTFLVAKKTMPGEQEHN